MKPVRWAVISAILIAIAISVSFALRQAIPERKMILLGAYSTVFLSIIASFGLILMALCITWLFRKLNRRWKWTQKHLS